MSRTARTAALALALLAAASGCFHKKCCLFKKRWLAPPATAAMPAAVLAPPVATEPTSYVQPGSPVQEAPPAATGYSTDMRYPAETARSSARGAGPEQHAGWQTPLTTRPYAARPQVRATEPPRPKLLPPTTEPTAKRVERRAALPATPGSEIPGYYVVEPNVATGGQPTLEGLRWLQSKGFRTVVNLRPEQDADPAEAGLVRHMGMQYVSIAVSPQTLDAKTLEQFNRIVDDTHYRPLFIHDKTGSAVGALWYLHLVYVDGVSDESARRIANLIGLKPTDTEWWLAIQKLLAQNPPNRASR